VIPRRIAVGKFVYEGTTKVDFEDRLLAHLQLVISAKLRRGEPFHFTWKDDPSTGNGRTAVWVHPAASMTYRFYGSRQPPINRAWVEALMHAANSPTGLYAVSEPDEEALAMHEASIGHGVHVAH
jgi:hypothetical protein